ncbi:MAG: hypothetical protein RQM95_07635 [Syntrophaceticus schinkii]
MTGYRRLEAQSGLQADPFCGKPLDQAKTACLFYRREGGYCQIRIPI